MTILATRPSAHHPDSLFGALIQQPKASPLIAPAKPPRAAPDRTRKARSAPDSLNRYYASVKQYGLLDADGEVGLAKDIEAGIYAERLLADGNARSMRMTRDLEELVARGKAATEQFMVSNLRLVVHHSKGRQHRGLELEDLISEGNFGLLRAIEKFDYRMGNKFSTYASWWIIQSMERAIADLGRCVRLPVHQHELANQIRSTENRLGVDAKFKSGAEAVAEELGRDERTIAFTVRAAQPIRSLDLDVSDGRGGVEPLGNQIEDPNTEPIDAQVMAEAERQGAESMLNTLDQRTAQILRLRFGFEDGHPHTLQEIGDLLGVTRERIRQLEKIGMATLRDAVTAGEVEIG